MVRTVASALALALSAPLWAADPLAGSWKLNRSKTQFHHENVINYDAHEGGIRYRTPLSPVYAGKFDDREYPVLNDFAATDKVKLKRIDDNTYEATVTRNGEKRMQERVAVSDGGKVLTRRVTTWDDEGHGTTNVYHYARSGGDGGPMPFVGAWTEDRAKTEYGEEPRPLTIAEQGGGLHFTFPGSRTAYTVVFDGKPVAATGSPLANMRVSGKRIDDNTAELTYWLGDEKTNVVNLSLEPGGKAMIVKTQTFPKGGGAARTQTSYFERQ